MGFVLAVLIFFFCSELKPGNFDFGVVFTPASFFFCSELNPEIPVCDEDGASVSFFFCEVLRPERFDCDDVGAWVSFFFCPKLKPATRGLGVGVGWTSFCFAVPLNGKAGRFVLSPQSTMKINPVTVKYLVFIGITDSFGKIAAPLQRIGNYEAKLSHPFIGYVPIIAYDQRPTVRGDVNSLAGRDLAIGPVSVQDASLERSMPAVC